MHEACVKDKVAGGREEKARRVSLAKALCNQKLDSLSEVWILQLPTYSYKKGFTFNIPAGKITFFSIESLNFCSL